jgi:hypothetical protein
MRAALCLNPEAVAKAFLYVCAPCENSRGFGASFGVVDCARPTRLRVVWLCSNGVLLPPGAHYLYPLLPQLRPCVQLVAPWAAPLGRILATLLPLI